MIFVALWISLRFCFPGEQSERTYIDLSWFIRVKHLYMLNISGAAGFEILVRGGHGDKLQHGDYEVSEALRYERSVLTRLDLNSMFPLLQCHGNSKFAVIPVGQAFEPLCNCKPSEFTPGDKRVLEECRRVVNPFGCSVREQERSHVTAQVKCLCLLGEAAAWLHYRGWTEGLLLVPLPLPLPLFHTQHLPGRVTEETCSSAGCLVTHLQSLLARFQAQGC